MVDPGVPNAPPPPPPPKIDSGFAAAAATRSFTGISGGCGGGGGGHANESDGDNTLDLNIRSLAGRILRRLAARDARSQGLLADVRVLSALLDVLGSTSSDNCNIHSNNGDSNGDSNSGSSSSFTTPNSNVDAHSQQKATVVSPILAQLDVCDILAWMASTAVGQRRLLEPVTPGTTETAADRIGSLLRTALDSLLTQGPKLSGAPDLRVTGALFDVYRQLVGTSAGLHILAPYQLARRAATLLETTFTTTTTTPKTTSEVAYGISDSALSSLSSPSASPPPPSSSSFAPDQVSTSSLLLWREMLVDSLLAHIGTPRGVGFLRAAGLPAMLHAVRHLHNRQRRGMQVSRYEKSGYGVMVAELAATSTGMHALCTAGVMPALVSDLWATMIDHVDYPVPQLPGLRPHHAHGKALGYILKTATAFPSLAVLLDQREEEEEEAHEEGEEVGAFYQEGTPGGAENDRKEGQLRRPVLSSKAPTSAIPSSVPKTLASFLERTGVVGNCPAHRVLPNLDTAEAVGLRLLALACTSLDGASLLDARYSIVERMLGNQVDTITDAPAMLRTRILVSCLVMGGPSERRLPPLPNTENDGGSPNDSSSSSSSSHAELKERGEKNKKGKGRVKGKGNELEDTPAGGWADWPLFSSLPVPAIYEPKQSIVHDGAELTEAKAAREGLKTLLLQARTPSSPSTASADDSKGGSIDGILAAIEALAISVSRSRVGASVFQSEFAPVYTAFLEHILGADGGDGGDGGSLAATSAAASTAAAPTTTTAATTTTTTTTTTAVVWAPLPEDAPLHPASSASVATLARYAGRFMDCANNTGSTSSTAMAHEYILAGLRSVSPPGTSPSLLKSTLPPLDSSGCCYEELDSSNTWRGHDWLAGTICLLAGADTRRAHGLLSFLALRADAPLLWPWLGNATAYTVPATSARRRSGTSTTKTKNHSTLGPPPPPHMYTMTAHQLEVLVHAELPAVHSAFKQSGLTVSQIVVHWLSQCFLNYLDWPEVAAFVTLTLARGPSFPVLYCTAVLSHLQPLILREALRDGLAECLKGGPIEGFRLATHFEYMQECAEKHAKLLLA